MLEHHVAVCVWTGQPVTVEWPVKAYMQIPSLTKGETRRLCKHWTPVEGNICDSRLIKAHLDKAGRLALCLWVYQCTSGWVCSRGHGGHKRSKMPVFCPRMLCWCFCLQTPLGFVWVYQTSPCHLLLDISKQPDAAITVSTHYCADNEWLQFTFTNQKQTVASRYSISLRYLKIKN